MAIPYMLAISGNSADESRGMIEVNHTFGLVEEFSPPEVHLFGSVDNIYWTSRPDGFPLTRKEAGALKKLFSGEGRTLQIFRLKKTGGYHE